MPIYANRAECSETLATEEMSLEFFLRTYRSLDSDEVRRLTGRLSLRVPVNLLQPNFNDE